MENLPFSQACENNKTFILKVLRRHLLSGIRVLETGSGTGQHAEFFASSLPGLTWQASDLAGNLTDLNRRLLLADQPNLPEAIELDVTWPQWPCDPVDAVFTANSLHIMPASAVELFIRSVCRYLKPGGLLLVYGPFKYTGAFTTESNARFDEWLKLRDPASGIRDFVTVNDFAVSGGLELLEDNAMPANNQLLVWRKAAV